MNKKKKKQFVYSIFNVFQWNIKKYQFLYAFFWKPKHLKHTQTIVYIRFGMFFYSQIHPNHYIRKVWELWNSQDEPNHQMRTGAPRLNLKNWSFFKETLIRKSIQLPHWAQALELIISPRGSDKEIDSKASSGLSVQIWSLLKENSITKSIQKAHQTQASRFMISEME